MKIDLAVIGQGAVSPAGVGVDALLHRKAAPLEVGELGRPDHTWPVLRVDQKDPAFARWQKESRLRRASPITFFLVEAAEQALAGITAEQRAETGLIVCYSAGCLVYSRRFFEGIIKQGQRTASPALFPETVFNSPVSHLATVLGLNGAAYALVGDETAWATALQTASTWLKTGRVKQVVVLGVEEFDPLVLDAYRAVGWLRGGFLTSEGAAGVLVRAAQAEEKAPVISTARDGWIYRSKSEATLAAGKMMSEIDLPVWSSARNNWLTAVEKKVIAKCTLVSDERPYLGEAFTASAAWNTLRALASGTPHLAQPIWGLNHQLAFLELRDGIR